MRSAMEDLDRRIDEAMVLFGKPPERLWIRESAFRRLVDELEARAGRPLGWPHYIVTQYRGVQLEVTQEES